MSHCGQTSTYLLFMRIQHISLVVIVYMYKAFKFNLCTVSSISFKKGNILQSENMAITDIFTTFNGICGVYPVCVFMVLVYDITKYRCKLFRIRKVYVS